MSARRLDDVGEAIGKMAERFDAIVERRRKDAEEPKTLHFASASAVNKKHQERRRASAEAHRQELRELVASGKLTQEQAEERGL